MRFASRPVDKSRIAPVYPELMGEVVVQVRLENSGDRFLQASGVLAEEKVKFVEEEGVVDSSAVLLAFRRMSPTN